MFWKLRWVLQEEKKEGKTGGRKEGKEGERKEGRGGWRALFEGRTHEY